MIVSKEPKMMEDSLNNLINQLFDDVAKNGDGVLNTEQVNSLVEVLSKGIKEGRYDETAESIIFSEEKSTHFLVENQKAFNHRLLDVKIRCYFYQGNYDLLTQLCEKYVEKNDDFQTQIAALEGIAVVYQQRGELDIAYDYLSQLKDLLHDKRAEDYFGKHGYRYNAMINMGCLYHLIEDYDEAFKYYDKAFEIAEKHLELHRTLLLQVNIIALKSNSKRITFEEAIIAINKILQSPSLDKNILDLASINKASFLLEKKETKAAFQILKSYLPLSEHKTNTGISSIIQYYMSYLFLIKDYTTFKQTFEENELLVFKNRTCAISILEKYIQIAEEENDLVTLTHYQKKVIELEREEFKDNNVFVLQKAKAQEQIKLKEKEIRHLREVQSLKDKLNEELSKKNKELENFASVAAHDLKAPLRNISSFSKLIKRQLQSNDGNKELFGFIEMAADQMQELVDGLLTFAKAGKFKGKAEELDLNYLLQAVQTNLQSNISQKNATILIHKHLPTLKIHRLPTLQLFQNLIANSIKFTHSNIEPFIQINYQKEMDYHHISIQDNGIGIEEEYLTKVFQPLVRLHTNDEFEGAGLGLATCAKIVHKLNGQIYIQSEVGNGSTFNVLLPINT